MITDDISPLGGYAGLWLDRRVKIGYETAEELAKHYNPLNFRGHPENQRDATEESLDALGYVGQVKKSLHSGVILDGHLRIEIALAKDPAIQLPVDYYDLTPDEELLALQVLDTTTEMAQPIADKLAALMERTKHLTADKPGLAAMLEQLKVRAGVNGNGNTPPENTPQIDKAGDLQKIWNTAQGQIWQLGNHRLACGDCTDRATVDAVMGGEIAEMTFIDPPYNALKSWNKDKAHSETRLDPSIWFDNDNMEWPDYWAFVKRLFEALQGHSIYICCDYRIYAGIKDKIEQAGYETKHCIVWKKNIWGLGKRYRFQHEFIVYACKQGAPFYGDRSQGDVWEIDTDRNTYHNTPKPVELPARAISNSSKIGAVIFDGCLGSGTTLIACENLNRRCRAIELDPGYCAVSIQRWVDLTGQQPRLISG